MKNNNHDNNKHDNNKYNHNINKYINISGAGRHAQLQGQGQGLHNEGSLK